MSTNASLPPPLPHHLDRWAMAFEEDPPLHTQFPITLPNASVVFGVTCICAKCGNTVDKEMVHGRVFWSLPTVATTEATGYCKPCQVITRINCRFRPHENDFQIEWFGKDNRWRTQVMLSPSRWQKLVKRFKAVIAMAERRRR